MRDSRQDAFPKDPNKHEADGAQTEVQNQTAPVEDEQRSVLDSLPRAESAAPSASRARSIWLKRVALRGRCIHHPAWVAVYERARKSHSIMTVVLWSMICFVAALLGAHGLWHRATTSGARRPADAPRASPLPQVGDRRRRSVCRGCGLARDGRAAARRLVATTCSAEAGVVAASHDPGGPTGQKRSPGAAGALLMGDAGSKGALSRRLGVFVSEAAAPRPARRPAFGSWARPGGRSWQPRVESVAGALLWASGTRHLTAGELRSDRCRSIG